MSGRYEFTDANGQSQWIEHRQWLTYGDREDFEKFYRERMGDSGEPLPKTEQLEFTITAWSFKEPVTAENIRKLCPWDIYDAIVIGTRSPNASGPSSNGTAQTKAATRGQSRSRRK